MPEVSLLPIKQDLVTGIDVGGTKVHVADTLSSVVRRYSTPEYPNMEAILEAYFQEIKGRPSRIVMGMAGPRDDETGEIKVTNSLWPAFNPADASARYGIAISTANDMVVTTAGVLHESGLAIQQLKHGTPALKGTKLAVTISTGIGASAAHWDSHSGRYIILPSEGGHIGFQPKDDGENDYLNYLHKKYPHASAELALSGMHGIDNLIDHGLEPAEAQRLSKAITSARKSARPVGTVLLEFATQGEGKDRKNAQKILSRMGAMVGSYLRDLTTTFNATGGVYLTGSVSLGLGEYLAEYTELNSRFVREGAVHADRLEQVPIYLITDPNVAVVGALALAKGL